MPTPLREGQPDLSYIEAVARTLAPLLRPGRTVVLESTTYPGTTEELVAPLLEDGSGLTRRRRLPPRLQPRAHRPGQPDLAAGRTRPRSSPAWTRRRCAAVRELLRPARRHHRAGGARPRRPSWPSCWRTPSGTSTSPWSTRSRCSPTTSASTSGRRSTRRPPSRSASCVHPGPGRRRALPADRPVATCPGGSSATLGQQFRFVELANDINEPHARLRRARLIDGAQPDAPRRSTARRILLLGLAYKKNTGDARESPARARRRAAAGPGRRGARGRPARRGEPIPAAGGCVRVELTAEELAAADAVVLLTDHDEFDYDLVAERAALVLDCRRRLSRQAAVELL